jgi:sugar-specific transcriptional regulator TrmB
MAGQTVIQESAQALFCAVADFLGEAETKKAFDVKKYPTYQDFYTKYTPPSRYNKNINVLLSEAFKKYVNAPGVTLKTVEQLFKKDNDWYKSSVNIAKKMMEEIDTIDQDFKKIQKVNWADVFYVRGDKEIMGNIEILFKRANETLKKMPIKGAVIFGNVNKWSPADIYFASKEAHKKIADKARSNEPITFMQLNNFISDLIDSGDLLPLSLKKQPNNVIIKKVNFNRKKELQELQKYSFVSVSPKERYLEVKINKTDSKAQFSFTHDPSGNVYKASIILSREARGGSVSGNIIPDIIKIVDPAFGNKFYQVLQKTKKDFAREKANYIRSAGKSDREMYDLKMAELSKTLVTDHLNKLLVDYLNKNKSKKSDMLVRLWLEYAASSTIISAKFVLAK